MNKSHLIFLGILAITLNAASTERRTATMLLVPNGAISIDGQDEDWQRLGAAFTQAKLTPDWSKSLTYSNPDQGEYAGPEDLSFEVWVAVDAENLYVLAQVRDQLLYNDSVANLYEGDDLEIFIDANLPEKQFAKERNENCRQIILLPQHMSLIKSGAETLWSDQPVPDMQMQSRLHTWGYTLEVKIPKAVFPNWKAHPEQARIGFDVSVSDSDTPGVDSLHGPMKYVGFLLYPANHFLTAEFLSTLKASKSVAKVDNHSDKTVAPRMTADRVVSAIREAKTATADEAAEMVLDKIDDPAAATIAAAAVASPLRALRKAGLFILAKRPDLPAPLEMLIAGLQAPVLEGYLFDPDLISFALVSLAIRHKLPVNDDFNTRFGTSFHTPVRLTYTWCLGRNSDRSATSFLIKQLADKNLRVRIKAVRALGTLHDPAALPALIALSTNDHQYAQIAAKAVIAEFVKP